MVESEFWEQHGVAGKLVEVVEEAYGGWAHHHKHIEIGGGVGQGHGAGLGCAEVVASGSEGVELQIYLWHIARENIIYSGSY